MRLEGAIVAGFVGAALILVWSTRQSENSNVAPISVVVGAPQASYKMPDGAANTTPGAARDSSSVAVSEHAAAQPPAGGPGPDDVRPRKIPPQTQARPIYFGQLVSGVRLNGTGSDFYRGGFHDGDVLVSVDARPIASISSGQAAAAMLVPGAMVEVTRNGQQIAWRIGGKAE